MSRRRCCQRPTHYPNGVTLSWAPSANAHLVMWRALDGRRRQARAREHDDAVDLAFDVAAQLSEDPTPPPPSAGHQSHTVTVPELVADYVRVAARDRGWSRAYRLRCQSLLDTWISPHLNVDTASWRVADTLALLDVAADTSASSRKQLLGLLRRAARHGRARGWLNDDPCADLTVPAPRKQRPTAVVADEAGGIRLLEVNERPTVTEVERLGASFDRADESLATRLAAYTGMRWGETFALEAADLDFTQGRIHIARRVDPHRTARDGTVMTPDGSRPRYWRTPYGYAALPKGDKTRVTLLPHHLTDELAAHARHHDLLFPSRVGTYRTHSNFDRFGFHRAREAAGWPQRADGRWLYTFHTLRHFGATWLLEELGLGVHQVALLLGHADATTTMRMYVHATLDTAQTASVASQAWTPPVLNDN